MLKIGERVRFRLGCSFVRARVIEYRGLLAGGKPMYRVRRRCGLEYELPLKELRVAN